MLPSHLLLCGAYVMLEQYIKENEKEYNSCIDYDTCSTCIV